MEKMPDLQSRPSKNSSMDSISAVIHHEKPRAVFPIVCADHAAWIEQIDFEKAVTDARLLALIIEKACQRYKYDMALLFSDAYVEAQALGCPVRLSPFPALTGSRTMEHIDRTDVIIEAASILNKTLAIPVFVSIKGPFSLASFLAGIEDFLIMTIKDPSAAQDLLDEALDFQISYVDKLLKLGVHVFIGDPVASASVISPDSFSRFAFGPLAKLVKKIKAMNAMAGVHICGDTRAIIDQLDALAADILSIEDITVFSRTLKMGGVSTSTIRHGSFKDISDEIDATCEEPYLILSTSCDVPIETPPENILHLVNHLHD